jgi:hypothetical protein
MSHSDSDDDLQKYMPRREDILREADPAYREKKLRDAVNEARKEGPSPYEIPISELQRSASTQGAALRTPQVTKRSAATPRRKRAVPAWAVYTMAVLAVLGPAALVFVLVKAPPPSAGRANPASGAGTESANGAATSAGALPPGDADVDGGASTSEGADASTLDASSMPDVETTAKRPRAPMPIPNLKGSSAIPSPAPSLPSKETDAPSAPGMTPAPPTDEPSNEVMH